MVASDSLSRAHTLSIYIGLKELPSPLEVPQDSLDESGAVRRDLVYTRERELLLGVIIASSCGSPLSRVR